MFGQKYYICKINKKNPEMLPPFLKSGDHIRIVSPSGNISPELIDGAKLFFEKEGYYVSVGKYAKNIFGRFAGNELERTSDLQEALDNPEIKAILCSRGGYGLSQIIDKLNFKSFNKTPKWLIGFSDITILHSVINKNSIGSLHSIMAKHLTELSANSEQITLFNEILKGKLPTYVIQHSQYNRNGICKGKLIGGNLSVLMGLRGSRFEPDYRDKILFIEDIAEKPYHIDRMMQNLRLSGILNQISGLVVGQFSDCEEDPLMRKTIPEIIYSSVGEYHYPVCFNFPAGHVDYNLPLVLGTEIQLTVNDNISLINY